MESVVKKHHAERDVVVWKELASEHRYDEAFVELKKLAEEGDADAQFWVGYNYNTGSFGVKKNDEKAQFWYFKAYNQRHALAVYHYIRYMENDPPEKDLEIINNDNFVLALCYFWGYHRNIDDYVAFEYLQKSDQNCPYVQHILCSIFEFGWGVCKSPTIALTYAKKSAKQGFSDAIESYISRLLKINIKKAFKWYKRLVKNRKCHKTDNSFPTLLPFKLRDNTRSAIVTLLLIQKKKLIALTKDTVYIICKILWNTNNKSCWDFWK
jgi:hypothetical protein